MIPLIHIFYHGEVNIEYWEYSVAFLYIVVLYLRFARQKNIMVKKFPEYRYYLWGFLAKLFGGLVFSLIYFYYYQGGDTTAYFYSAVAMRNLAVLDPLEYLTQLFGDNSMRAWSVYTWDTAKPYQYVFFDDRTFVVIQLTSLLAILTFNSYLITTLLIASVSFFGVWQAFRTFVSYFPQLTSKLAIAFLFMPSSVFWGSAILKDTFSFSAVCFWVHAVDEVFFKRRNVIQKSVVLGLSGLMMILVKPYIFMVLFPATVLWVFYFRVVKLKNALVKFLLVPISIVGMGGASYYVLNRMGGQLDKFALDGAMKTIQTTQGDLLNSESYGSNSFNVGELDGTWLGALSKFPIATGAAFFRPYLWEANNAVMMLSGLENFWVLCLAIFSVLRAGPLFMVRSAVGIPILLMSVVFALFFAFTVGITTPNFGALVRFKIPMVPFFISSLFITVYLAKIKRELEEVGSPFDLRDFRMGTGHFDLVGFIRKKRAGAAGAKKMLVKRA